MRRTYVKEIVRRPDGANLSSARLIRRTEPRCSSLALPREEIRALRHRRRRANRARANVAHVRFIFDAEARSTFAAPSCVAEIPHGVDIIMLGEEFGERVAVACDDVDDAGGHVGGLENTIEVGCGERIGL